MAERPNISVIIVNYNGQQMLPVVLSSLRQQTYKDFEIIIIDNGSTDESRTLVRKNFAEVNLLISPKNSYAIANNLGIAAANGQYCFFLNNDTELDTSCLQNLADNAQRTQEGIGMWATKIRNYYHRDVIDNTGLLLFLDGLSRGRGRLERDHGQYDTCEEVLCPSGCAGMFRTDLVRDVGGFDEDFEFYVEDVDLGYRCRLAGRHCIYVPNAIVYHMYSATGGEYTPRKAFLVERNRLWFAIKEFPVLLVLMLPLTSLFRYCFQAYGAITKQGAAGQFVERYSRFGLVVVLFRAWLAAIQGVPKMLRKRRKWQVNKRRHENPLTWFRKFGISARGIALQD